MNSCGDCSKLENRLQRANDYYVRLILVHDRMARDGNAEIGAFDNSRQEAQNSRTSAALDLLAHRGTHNATKTSLGRDDQLDIPKFANSFLDDPLAHLPRSRILEYDAGQLIYSFDQPAEGLYLVIDGKVTVCRSEDNGRPVVVDIYQVDEFFGECALLRFPHAQEQAVALEHTKVMIWSTVQIEDIIIDRPQLAVGLLQVLALRLMDFKSRLHSFASDPTPRRLARTLIRFSERLGQTNEDGSVQMIPFTHKLLGQYVGTRREVITVFMNRFRREGYLDYSRKGNIVIHRDALTEWLRQPSAAQQGRARTVAMAG